MRILTIALLLFGAVITPLSAQTGNTTTLKIAYVDVDYILSEMPESKQAETDLTSLQAQLKKQIDDKTKELQDKYTAYQNEGADVPDAVKQSDLRELNQLNQNLQQLQTDAQDNLQKKQDQLMDPILAKVDKAISDVAKDGGYDLILNLQYGQVNVVLYGDKKLDVSDVVLKKMGITPQPPAAGTPTQPALTK